MNVPPWAGFVANFPDDQVATADKILVYGGRNVAIALEELLAGLGCSNAAAPWDVSDVGWEFDFNYRGRHRFLCRVQSFHPVFWLLFEGPSNSRKAAAAYVELWRKFGSALEGDSRFRKILWRSFEEGPPDWEEVEAAAHPPKHTFAEEFAATELDPHDLRPGCLSVLFGIPFMFFGAGWTISYSFFYKTPDRWEIVQTSIGFFLFGFVIFYWARIRWWIDGLRSPSPRWRA